MRAGEGRKKKIILNIKKEEKTSRNEGHIVRFRMHLGSDDGRRDEQRPARSEMGTVAACVSTYGA